MVYKNNHLVYHSSFVHVTQRDTEKDVAMHDILLTYMYTSHKLGVLSLSTHSLNLPQLTMKHHVTMVRFVILYTLSFLLETDVEHCGGEPEQADAGILCH